jgi:hypothetical protein
MDELFIEAKLENMDAVQDFISAHLSDCPPKIRNQIGIAVDEIFSNIARYSYASPAGCAAVRIAVDSDITIEFEDSGMEYDPRLNPNPSLEYDQDSQLGKKRAKIASEPFTQIFHLRHPGESRGPGLFLKIGVGTAVPPLPPNRACGFPAHGSPVDGFFIEIGTPQYGLGTW